MGFRFSVTFSALLFLACSTLQAQTKNPVPMVAPVGTATITGRVLIKGEPAIGVNVALQPMQQSRPAQGPNKTSSAKTNGSGQFLLTGVVAGRYVVNPAAPAYITKDDGRNPVGQLGTIINVADGENIEGIEIELKRGGVITGRVTDAQGRPAVEERLHLSKFDRQGKLQPIFTIDRNFAMSMTDDRGIYRLYGLDEGRYLINVGVVQTANSITFTRSTTSYPITYYPNAHNEAEAKPIEVTAGSEIIDIDIKLPEAISTRRISGRVLDAETNQPVAGVEISYGAQDDKERIGAWGSNGERSKENGEFQMMSVLPGKYAVFAGARGESDYYSESVTCDVRESDVTDIEIKMLKGGSISGTGVVEGTTDPKILAQLAKLGLYTYNSSRQSGSPSNQRASIKADGGFQIKGLSPGKILFSTTNMPPGFSLARIELNGEPQKNGIEVSAGENVTGVRLVFSYGTITQRGEVKIIGGQLAPDFKFTVLVSRSEQSEGGGQFVQVDARGRFVIENLAPGEYDVKLTFISYPGMERPSPQLLKSLSETKTKIVIGGDNPPPITITLDLSKKEGNR